MKTDFIAIDTETGGLHPGTHALLSLAAVPSWETEPFQVFIEPEGVVEPDAARVNGYTVELWQQRNALPLKQALLEFMHWLEKSGARARKAMPLAHNAAFDRAFVQAAERRTGYDFGLSHRWRCSMVTMLALQDAGYCNSGKFASLNELGTVSGFWKKEEARAAAHDALQDARCCLHGYRFLTGLIEKREVAAA
jgi:DNA polymerase III epsilon subunit-like protein